MFNLSLQENYDPGLKVNGTHVITAFLPQRRKASVRFYYNIPGGQDRVNFHQLLAYNHLSAPTLFSLFCAGWVQETTFNTFKSKGIEDDIHLFAHVDNTDEYCLSVEIRGIDKAGVNFFLILKDATPVSMRVENKKSVNKVYKVVSHYFKDTLEDRKRALYCLAHHIPYETADSSVIATKYIVKDNSLREHVNQKIHEDKFLHNDIKQGIVSSKPSLTDYFDDEHCADIKKQLKAKMETLLKQSATDSVLHDKYRAINHVLDTSFYDHIKHYSLAYVFLDHLIEFLYDEEDESSSQSLYQVVRDWMVRIEHQYFLTPFNGERASKQPKQYRVSEQAKMQMQGNAFGERYYTADHFVSMIELLRPFVDLHDFFMATPIEHYYVYFKQNMAEGRVEITLDNRFQLLLPMKDFYWKLRKQKLNKSINLLIKEKGIPQPEIKVCDNIHTTFYPEFLTDPRKSFFKMKNKLKSGDSLFEILHSDIHPDTHIISILSVEEKISLLVSLWIVECRFHRDDSPSVYERKKKDFLGKVNAFLDMNCNESDSAFRRDDLASWVAFYIAKNKAKRMTNVIEHESDSERFTLERRVDLYQSVFPSTRLPVGAKLTDIVNQLYITSTPIHEQDYLLNLYAIARPYFSYLKDSRILSKVASLFTYTRTDPEFDKLVNYTNFLLAMINAGFLDSNCGHEKDSTALIRSISRRECMLEIMFHIVLEKVDIIAKRKYPTASHEHKVRVAAINFFNKLMVEAKLFKFTIAKYDPQRIDDLRRHYNKTDAFLISRQRKKTNKRRIVCISAPNVNDKALSIHALAAPSGESSHQVAVCPDKKASDPRLLLAEMQAMRKIIDDFGKYIAFYPLYSVSVNAQNVSILFEAISHEYVLISDLHEKCMRNQLDIDSFYCKAMPVYSRFSSVRDFFDKNHDRFIQFFEAGLDFEDLDHLVRHCINDSPHNVYVDMQSFLASHKYDVRAALVKRMLNDDHDVLKKYPSLKNAFLSYANIFDKKQAFMNELDAIWIPIGKKFLSSNELGPRCMTRQRSVSLPPLVFRGPTGERNSQEAPRVTRSLSVGRLQK